MEVVTRADVSPRAQFYGDFQGFESNTGTRKLFQSRMEEGADPVPSSTRCRDVTTGALAKCKNPHTVVLIIGAMTFMLFLVTIAWILLCHSFFRRRRMQGDSAESSPASLRERPALEDIPGQYDSAVLVQFPGDKKPHFFALPAPLAGQGKDAEKEGDPGGSDDGDGQAAEEQNYELPPEEPIHDDDDELRTETTRPQLSSNDAHQAQCVLADDGSYQNPLFMPG